MFCAWTMMRFLSLTLQPHHKERHKSVAEWQRKSEERQCVSDVSTLLNRRTSSERRTCEQRDDATAGPKR